MSGGIARPMSRMREHGPGYEATCGRQQTVQLGVTRGLWPKVCICNYAAILMGGKYAYL